MIMVSIIVPAYNAVETIEKCITSLISQNYSDIEIIIVNDGSNDHSRDIAQKYAQIDSRIVVYNQINKGVSAARNKGIELSHGEFIMFVDSDDWVPNNYVGDFIKWSDDNDVVIDGIKLIDSKNDKLIKKIGYDCGYYSPTQYALILDSGKMNPFFGGPYGKLFRAEIIKNNNIKFIEKQSVAEDFCFNLDFLCYARNIHVIDKYNYHYYVNNENSLFANNYKKLCPDDFFEQEHNTFDHFVKYTNLIKFKSSNKILYQLWIMYISKVNQDRHINFVDRVRMITQKSKLYPEISQALKISNNLSFKEKCVAKASNNKVGIFIICLILGRRYSEK